MTGLQIKVNGKWLELPDDFSVSIETVSPLFNTQGTFSFPFEIPLDRNRGIFGNIADPFGDITLSDIDGMEAEIWFDQVLISKGVIEVDEEMEFGDSLSVTFLSGNSDFYDRIEEMEARDVPLDREIKLGYAVTAAWGQLIESSGLAHYYKIPLPGDIMMVFTECNVSDPYPVKPYCNARACCSDSNGGYMRLDADRPYSGVCYYVMYFLDCLFAHLGIRFDKSAIEEVEDYNRMAFFSLYARTEMKGETGTATYKQVAAEIGDFTLDLNLSMYVKALNIELSQPLLHAEDFSYNTKDVYATNGDFPDVPVNDIIDDLRNAFGICLVFSNTDNTVKAVSYKKVFTDTESLDLHAEILERSVNREKPKPIRLTYGVEDDTAFNYADYSNVEQYDSYLNILQRGLSQYETAAFADSMTGNVYRVKVNKDTGGDPALFEVAGFRDYVEGAEYGGEEEEVQINFSPVIVNDVNGKGTQNRAYAGESAQQVLSVYADVEMESLPDNKLEMDTLYVITSIPAGNPLGSHIAQGETVKFSCTWPNSYDMEENEESPLSAYDQGYTIGIMRGPGNEAGLEITDKNYDDENNDSWVQTVGTYAFTSDSCDNFGRYFDYNGTETGGIDQEGRFSLKLAAWKENLPVGDGYRGRGLVDKFLSEYLYFMVHKKTVTLQVRMEITQILNVDFTKRYSIGEHVGYINRISYTVSPYGLENVEIELYSL